MLIFHRQNLKCVKDLDVFFVLHSLQMNSFSVPLTVFSFVDFSGDLLFVMYKKEKNLKGSIK